MDKEVGDALKLFVKQHDDDAGHHHMLAACPYKLLAQLLVTEAEETLQNE